MTEPSGPAARVWRSRLLDYLDGHAADMVADLADLVQVPSISGTPEENAIQGVLTERLAGAGLDVDAWPIAMAETLAAEDFPGMEVDRAEAWGTVGRLPGTGDGASLMLNAHVDVVPPGDLDPWGDQVPFCGTVGADAVYGRGACDMKAGLVAALWAVRAFAALRVPLRGDLILGTVVGEEDGGLGTYAMLRRVVARMRASSPNPPPWTSPPAAAARSPSGLPYGGAPRTRRGGPRG